MKQDKPSKKKPPLNNYVRYSSLAFQMIVIILLFVFGGRKLDLYLSMKFPVFTTVLSFLGVLIAIYISIKDFIKK